MELKIEKTTIVNGLTFKAGDIVEWEGPTSGVHNMYLRRGGCHPSKGERVANYRKDGQTTLCVLVARVQNRKKADSILNRK